MAKGSYIQEQYKFLPTANQWALKSYERVQSKVVRELAA